MNSVWGAAWQRFRADRVGRVAAAVVLAFLSLVAASALGWVGSDWQREVAVSHAPPTWMPERDEGLGAILRPSGPLADLSAVDPLAPDYARIDEATRGYQTQSAALQSHRPLGADRMGRDVLNKAIQGTQISVLVGLLAALVATVIGTVLGALAGFLGGRVGDFLEWLYNVFEAIPGILLILAFAAVFGRGLTTVVLILGLAGWTGLYRQVRSEFMKHAGREYVRAAQALGASAGSRMFRHILPNISHVILVRMGLMVVGCIKSEVILSYLGLGVGVDDVSWGTMLAEAQSELVSGLWWQLATATAFMAVFVTAFSLLADALRDALDPQREDRS